MSSADARALQLFREYLDLSAPARDKALIQLCTNDPQAHAILSTMLRAHARPHPIDKPLQPSFLEEEDEDEESPQETGSARIGSRLGPWQIDRIIAKGGMGTVYEAHRDDGHYRQRVALKCIRADLASPVLVGAFLAERDHLAQLEHPHIATLLDGGVDEGGAPWFAMRYVEGQAIDQWCDARVLSLERRVDLLLQACDALIYAHGQGILHQDLKPSNLLVTAQGEVQLLDFGLSSPQASAMSAKPLAISPGYTAPEIVHRGAAPSAAADLYSLGIVLTRLLCGITPVHSLLSQAGLANAGLPQLALQAPPGTARLRGLRNEAALAGRLTGDLDAIVNRCTHPDPGRRYRSAGELHEDLHRWRTRLPVWARAGGLLYRSGRFLSRHRIAASLGGLVLLSSAIGLGTVAWLQQRTEREAQATRTVARLFEQSLGSATLSGLSETPFSSAQLLQRTEAQVRELPLQDQPKVLAQALASLARSQAVIGDYRHATALASEAARLHGRGDAPSAETQATLAALLNIEARHAEAQKVANHALTALTADDEESRPVRLRLMTEIARSLWERSERDQARRTLDSALALAEDDRVRDPSAYIELLILRGYWASQLFELAPAADDLDQAIAMATPDYPLLADNAKTLRARLYSQQEQLAQGLKLASDVLRSRRQRLGEAHPETGRAWVTLADSQSMNGERQQAKASIEQAKRILLAAYGPNHPEYADAMRASSYINMVGSDDDATYERGVEDMRQALRIRQAAYGPAHESVVRAQALLGIWLMNTGHTQNAHFRQYREEGIRILRGLFATSRRTRLPVVFAKLNLARVLMGHGQPGDMAEAHALQQEAQADIDRYFGPWHSSYLVAKETQAQFNYLSGDLAGADALLTSLMPQIAAQLPRNNARSTLCTSMQLHAAVASQQGDQARAKSLLLQLQKASRAESGLRTYASCESDAKEGLKELEHTGRYHWTPL